MIVVIQQIYVSLGVKWPNPIRIAQLFLVGFFIESVKIYVSLRPSKKKKDASRPDFYKKKRRAGGFFKFIISCCMLSLHIITFPQGCVGALIKRNIRYWLNISLFNFDTHKGLTVKVYIILVCTQQQWALHIFDVIRTPS